MLLMDNKKIDEKGGTEFHSKIIKMTGAVCLSLGGVIFANHCRDDSDIRVRISYAPLLLCVNLFWHYNNLYTFYNTSGSPLTNLKSKV